MNYINEIVNELLNGTFSVFCGAGADYDATHKEWHQIFTDKTQDFYNNKYSSDMYFLADLEKRYINPESFIEDVRNNILEYSDSQSTHIDNIVNLNINQIWTTNFDCVIENTVNRRLKINPQIIKESKDLFKVNLNAPYTVYKLNGSVLTEDNKNETMVLTKSDYFDYLEKQRLLFEILKRQLVLDTFLFVGYSFNDNLVLGALREIKKVFPCNGKTHYRFAKKNNGELLKQEYDMFEAQYYCDEYNIKTIFINEYTDIDKYLQELYRRFCNHNVLISGSFRYLKSNEERLYIEALVGSIIRSLTNNSFNIYSGNGRGLGEIVVAQIYNNKADNHFVNRPLIFTGDNEVQKQNKNQLIMKDCDTMIIICGQDDSLKSSQNVINQFRLFMNLHERNSFPLIIPIPSTGYAAKEIYYAEEFRNSNMYITNKKAFDNLASTIDVEEITRIVCNLVKSYKSENS